MGSPRLDIDEARAEGTVTLAVSGELDAASAPALAEAVERVSGSGAIGLDLSGVSFVDSSGIRVIAAASHDEVAVTAVSDAVRRVFEMAGLADLLPTA